MCLVDCLWPLCVQCVRESSCGVGVVPPFSNHCVIDGYLSHRAWPGALHLTRCCTVSEKSHRTGQGMLELNLLPAGKKININTVPKILWIYDKTKQHKTKTPNMGR